MLQRKYSNGVEVLSVNKTQIIERLKKIARQIKEEHPEIVDIILFGSFSKNVYVPFSDIDIAIIVEKSDKNFIQRQDEFIDYFLEMQIDVNLVIYTKEEIANMVVAGNNFVQEIKKGLPLLS